MIPWFIDAIDVRGGLAIATQRQSDLNRQALVEGGPSVFIAPPTFTPEFIASRSTAFALARGRGQAGLFDHKDQEVPFNSLASVAEFVRRTYLRGAAGDGTGENGGSSPPPGPEGPPGPERGEPGEPPEGLPRIGGDAMADRVDPVNAMLALARSNLETSERTPLGHSSPAQGLTASAPSAGPADPSHRRLARGALRLLRELIRRRPVEHDDRLRWLIVLERLAFFLTRTTLWPLMLVEIKQGASPDWLFGRTYHPIGLIDERLYRYVSDSVLDRSWDTPCWWARVNSIDSDKFDDLALFPAPPRTAPYAKKDGQNLQALLTSTIALPQELVKSTTESSQTLQQETAELVLFSASYLNVNGLLNHGIFGSDIDMSRTFADHVVSAAVNWLSANIPKLIFAPEVEGFISQASDVPA